MLSSMFKRFGKESPVCLMAAVTLERTFTQDALDDLFDEHATTGYQKELFFSDVVGLMVPVACRIVPSLHAAFKRSPHVPVSFKAVYDKLARIETDVSQALVRFSHEQMAPLVAKLGPLPAYLPGYETRILDGNCIEATHHRLEVLRDVAAGPLPGKSLVVLDPANKLVVDVFCCEDGHAQERALLDAVIYGMKEKQLWIADRNFCTVKFLACIALQQACFVIRRHANLPGRPVGKRRCLGRTAQGVVHEQAFEMEEPECGKTFTFRLVTLTLDEPTRDGETVIELLTNLPRKDASAQRVTELYQRRWTIEAAFAEIKRSLAAEINALGYPKAALFSFCVALVAYNVLAMIQAALRAAHGEEKIEGRISTYYLAEEITGTWRGLRIAIPDSDWQEVREMSQGQFLTLLRSLAAKVNLKQFTKTPRGPKKPRTARTRHRNQPHVATARLLAKSAPQRK